MVKTRRVGRRVTEFGRRGVEVRVRRLVRVRVSGLWKRRSDSGNEDEGLAGIYSIC